MHLTMSLVGSWRNGWLVTCAAALACVQACDSGSSTGLFSDGEAGEGSGGSNAQSGSASGGKSDGGSGKSNGGSNGASANDAGMNSGATSNAGSGEQPS